jgi:hypothetical protein
MSLDMKKTIEFYRSIPDIARARLEKLVKGKGESSEDFAQRGIYINDPEGHLTLTPSEIYGIINSLPETYRQRISINGIHGQAPLWFKSENLGVTTDKSEAQTPTSIVPSYISHATPEEAQRIVLFGLEDIEPEVARIIHAEGLIHELAHTANFPGNTGDYNEILDRGIQVELSKDRTQPLEEVILDFANLMEGSNPISIYSSHYWNNPNGEIQTNDLILAISEELSESIAAYLLGFAMTPDPEKRLTPFTDRPKIKRFIKDLLNSKYLVKK